MNKAYLKIFFSSLLLLGGTGCGDGAGQNVAEGGIEGTGRVAISSASVGTITGFSSVFVNGVKYETDLAIIDIDDKENATENDLEIGMVVTILGSVNEDAVTGDAQSIHYSENIKGLVEAIGINKGELIISGQEVTTDELTVYDNTNLETLMVGDFVEVSGLRNEHGVLLATRIEKERISEEAVIKIKGAVSGLDTVNRVFSLAYLAVDYSRAEITLDDEALLADGLIVKVKGHQISVGMPLIATNVELKAKDYEVEEGSVLKLDGIIDRYTSATDFTVNGQNITTNEVTTYKHGNSSFLEQGERVKVKGELTAEGLLIADEIKFHKESDYEVEGTVEAISIEANTVTVLGVTFVLNEETQFDDGTGSDIRFFNIETVNIGDFVEIKGFESNEVLIATKFERKDDNSDDKIELRGVATHIDLSQYTFNLSGVNIQTYATTVFKASSSGKVDQVTFFSSLEDNSNIKIKGNVVDGQVEATDVEVKVGSKVNENEIEIKGLVSRVDETGFMLLHYTIELSDQTEFEADSNALNLTNFLAQLEAGDEVEIEGVQEGDTIKAIRVVFES